MRHARPIAAALVLLSTGCFQQFEEFEQTQLPVRPPGATALPPGPAPEVFPLSVGSRFEYGARFGLGTGMFSGRAVVSVVDAWAEGTARIDQVRVQSSYFGQTRREAYRFVRTPEWIGLTEKYPPDQVTNFMPTALAVEQAWEVVTGEGKGQARVEAREDVAVPAGTFKDTYRVRYVNPGARTDMTLWMAPHVGLVKADVSMWVNVLPLRGSLALERHDRPL